MQPDRKSTRLNSSHTIISYAVFCLKKKKAPDIARARQLRGEANYQEGYDVDAPACSRATPMPRRRLPCCLASKSPPLFFFNDSATTEISPLSLPGALPI